MQFKFCPNCAKEINLGDLKIYKRFWKCDCGLELFNNVATAVGLIIKLPDGKILFERRAKEPKKGFLALPGGFTDPNESLEESSIREAKEEIGVEPTSLEYLTSFPNDYDYNNIKYKTCDVFFTAKIPENAELHAQESEILSFEPHFVRNLEELEALPIAFDSSKKALKKYIEKGN